LIAVFKSVNGSLTNVIEVDLIEDFDLKDNIQNNFFTIFELFFSVVKVSI
jgi:hypothetical protein